MLAIPDILTVCFESVQGMELHRLSLIRDVLQSISQEKSASCDVLFRELQAEKNDINPDEIWVFSYFFFLFKNPFHFFFLNFLHSASFSFTPMFLNRIRNMTANHPLIVQMPT